MAKIWEASVTRGDLHAWKDASSYELGSGVQPSRCLAPLGISTTNVYDPLTDEPDLYLKLASLESTETEIRNFVIRYGELGVPFLAGLDGAPGWSLKQVRSELRVYQRAFQEWRNNDSGQRVALKRLNNWARAILHHHPLRYVLTVYGSIPSAWLQLVIAMDENREMGSCMDCGNIFETKRQGPTRKYCDGTCKMRYRRRKKA